MRQIIYMSREQAEEFKPPVNSAILSIYTPGDKTPKLHGSWETIFYWAREDNALPVDSEYVEQIWAWVERNKHRNLYVHCDAGISRSGGVAHAIALYLAAQPVPLEHETDEILADLINARIKADLIRHLWEKRLVTD